jgi:hypothetical protein
MGAGQKGAPGLSIGKGKIIMQLFKRSNLSSILGLTLDGNSLQAVVVRRTNDSIEIAQSLSTQLSLNPLKNEPELCAREIRNLLDKAGISERRCVVGLPLSWALTVTSKVPSNLSAEDLDNLLSLEAERCFPMAVDSLLMGRTTCRGSGNADLQVLQAAVPRSHVDRLMLVLNAAHLKPLSLSFGISSMQLSSKGPAKGSMDLYVGDTSVDMQLSGDGGAFALRALETAYDSEGGEKRLHTDLIGREVRVTLGQLPPEARANIRYLRILGNNAFAQQLASAIQPLALSLGLAFDRIESYPAMEHGLRIPANTPISAPLSLALEMLSGQPPRFNFLPPKTSQWQQISARYSSRKLIWGLSVAASIALVILMMFMWQQWKLSRLSSRWKAMAPRVAELEQMKLKIRQYRPWFDESVATLSIMRCLTEAFPQDNSVSARILEIRELSTITCSGTARDNQALLKTLDQLRTNRDVVAVSVDQIQGKTPLRFTFTFNWNQGGNRER